MGKKAKKEQKERTTDLVVEALRSLIIGGDLQPGHSLSERVLPPEIPSLQTASRTPIAQSLVRLEAEGLVQRPVGQGARVARFTAEDTERLIALREAVELFLTLQIAAGPKPDVTELRQQVEMQAELAAAMEKEAFFDLGRSFHRSLTRLAGFGIVEDIVENMWARSTAAYSQRLSMRSLDKTVNGVDMHAISGEHDRIVKALSAKGKAARQRRCDSAVRAHFHKIRERAGVPRSGGLQ